MVPRRFSRVHPSGPCAAAGSSPPPCGHAMETRNPRIERAVGFLARADAIEEILHVGARHAAGRRPSFRCRPAGSPFAAHSGSAWLREMVPFSPSASSLTFNWSLPKPESQENRSSSACSMETLMVSEPRGRPSTRRCRGHGDRLRYLESQRLVPGTRAGGTYSRAHCRRSKVPEVAPVGVPVGVEIARRGLSQERFPGDVFGCHVRIDGPGPLRLPARRVAVHVRVNGRKIRGQRKRKNWPRRKVCSPKRGARPPGGPSSGKKKTAGGAGRESPMFPGCGVKKDIFPPLSLLRFFFIFILR